MKKHDYDKALYRVMTIWQKLREGEVLIVKELAEEFNVSTKTIQRDFNERLIHRFPIEKVGHKWKVKDGYSIDKNLTFEEDLVLDMLKEFASSMGNVFGTKADTLFSKIQNRHNSSIYSKLVIEDLSNETELMQQLHEAITNENEVKFYFKDKLRHIEPYKITNFEGYWYLYANEYLENKLKTFYIKDIKGLTITDKKFKKDTKVLRKLDLAINVWFKANAKPFEVRLLVLSDIAKYIIDRKPFNSTQTVVKEYEDGSVEITFMATSEREVSHEIKKYQPNLLIIEPKELVKEMIQVSRTYHDKQIDISL